MTSVYDGARIAAGYAFDRPAVHERILLPLAAAPRAECALDVGCGAGRSTAALAPYARTVVGLEPIASMLAHRSAVAPAAEFVVGEAERLPFARGSFDLVTAAGSLNYVDLDLFLPEAARVLTDGGRLYVYDFSEGRHAVGTDSLAGWFAAFEHHFPWPPGYRPLAPAALPWGEHGLRLVRCADTEVALELTGAQYLRYVLSEVNVNAALARGGSADEVVRWCTETLAPVFGSGSLRVRFCGYLAEAVRIAR
ncbi:class I SAM-dependent methyltransferase [Catellatospora tritici]|uniref:class I SAM-dependent methyltransferase n=1 Tax=Catellatospora tritici TaxID=2851566 RepID=UPI001C2D7465|nr:class I SAM-dependent methyltransferase [Catellatospora tritici]MBV1853060.1 methyltransferase domain-containing protein [Catellatospora tritici]